MIMRAVHMVALIVLCLSGCAEKKPSLVPAPVPVVKSNPDPREPANVRVRLHPLAEKAKANAKRAEVAAGRALAAAAGASKNETEARKSATAGDKDAQTQAAASAKKLAGQARGAAIDAAGGAKGAGDAAEQALSDVQQLGQSKDASLSDIVEASQTAEECRSAAAAAADASGKAAKYAALAERAARNAAEASVTAGKPNVQIAPHEVAASPAASRNEGGSTHPGDVSASGISSKSGLPLLPIVAEPKPSPSPAGQAGAAGTPTGTATTQPAEKESPPRPRVNLSALPTVPRLPSVQSRPSGIVLANKEASVPETCKGRWVQVNGGNAADFIPGGYSASCLAFRDDGTAEFSRTYSNGTITRKWRIGFEWNPKTEMLTLGSDPKNRPSADSLKGADIKALDNSVTLSARELPVAFRITRPSKNQIQFDGKTYERQAGQN
jgi:hypothetical protein